MTVQARLPNKQVRKSGKQLSIYRMLEDEEPKPHYRPAQHVRDVKPPSLLHGLEREVYDLLKVMLQTGPAIPRWYTAEWIGVQLGTDQALVLDALLSLRQQRFVLDDQHGEVAYWQAQRC